jgi:hypothetical protein
MNTDRYLIVAIFITAIIVILIINGKSLDPKSIIQGGRFFLK